MLKSSSEIPERIRRFNRNTPNLDTISHITLETYDIKTLYTNIPHDDLLTQLESRLKNT